MKFLTRCSCYSSSLVILLISLFSCRINPEKGLPGNLRCEYMVNPLGIDNPHPRLTWQLYDERMGARQTSFRIFIGTDSSRVAVGKGDIWISDKINSGLGMLKYEGNSLKPFTKYYWAVMVWGQARRRSEISPGCFF